MEPDEFEYKMICLLFALREKRTSDLGCHFDFSSMVMTKGPYPDSSSTQKKPLYEYVEPHEITKLLEVLKNKYNCFIDFLEKPYFKTTEDIIKAAFKQKKLIDYRNEDEFVSVVKRLSEQKKYVLACPPDFIERLDNTFKEFATKTDDNSVIQHKNDAVVVFTTSFNDSTGDFHINDVLFHHCEMGSDAYAYLSKAFLTEDGKVIDCHVSRQTIQMLFRDLGMTKAVWSLFFKRYKGKIGEKFQEKDKKKLFTFRRKVTLGEIRREKLDIKAARAEIDKRKEKSTP